MQISAEQIAIVSLASAIGMPLLTLIVQSRRAGRDAFVAETQARIQNLVEERDDYKHRYEDCHEAMKMRASIAGAADSPNSTVPMTEHEAKRLHETED